MVAEPAKTDETLLLPNHKAVVLKLKVPLQGTTVKQPKPKVSFEEEVKQEGAQKKVEDAWPTIEQQHIVACRRPNANVVPATEPRIARLGQQAHLRELRLRKFFHYHRGTAIIRCIVYYNHFHIGMGECLFNERPQTGPQQLARVVVDDDNRQARH